MDRHSGGYRVDAEDTRDFGQRQMSERLVQWATLTGDQTPPVQGLVAHHANFEEQWSAMESGFEEPEPTFHGVPLKDLSLAALLARLYAIRERIDDLQPWTDFKRLEGQCERAGLLGFLKQLQQESTTVRSAHTDFPEVYLSGLGHGHF